MATASELIIDHLRHDWATGLRITTIEQAMRALNLPCDDELRWKVGQALNSHWRRQMTWRKFFNALPWVGISRWSIVRRFMRLPAALAEAKEWNAASYILSNDEKLVARFILRQQSDVGRLPTLAEISRALELDATQTRAALRMLDHIGFVHYNDDSTFQLTPDHARLLLGLGFSFHMVTLESGDQFNVP